MSVYRQAKKSSNIHTTRKIMMPIADIYNRYEAMMHEYQARYGSKTVVVARVGEFDQILSIGDGLVDIDTLANVLDILVARQDKRNPVISRDNIGMCGWPTETHLARKYIDRLLAADYTVVIMPDVKNRDMNRNVIIYIPSGLSIV